MAQRLIELCKLFIENAFGDLAAQIFTTLASHGRISLGTLRQATGIPLRKLKAGIAVLSQHHIVLHYAEYADDPTFFQVDWHAAYTLVRTRKFIQLVRDREGEAASQLLASVLQSGHMSVEDLAAEYDINPPSKRDSGVDTVEEHPTEEGMLNGIIKDKPKIRTDKITTMPDLHETLIRLYEGGYLLKVTDHSSTPPADQQESMTETLIAEKFQDRKITGPKKGREFQDAFNKLKRKRQDEEFYSERRDAISRGELKKAKAEEEAAASCSKRTSKLRKTEEVIPNGISSSDEVEVEDENPAQRGVKLSNDTILRVNFQKCVLLMRNRRFEKMIDRLLGPVTSAVYRALLRAVEDKASPVKDPLKIEHDDDDDDEDTKEEPTLLSATDAEVLRQLDPSVDLAATMKGAVSYEKLPNGVGKPHIIPVDEDDLPLPDIKKEEASDNEDDDKEDVHDKSMKEHNHRLKLLNQHLCLLAEHPKHLCIREESATSTTIDITALAQNLIDTSVDATVNARFGKLATRFVRMLRSQKGKLAEKQLVSASFQRFKDTCALLTLLQFHGIADCVELPKDNLRITQKTVYIWWLNTEDVRRKILDKCYIGMERCLQRLRWERDEKFKGVLDKMEMVGEEMLGTSEKKMIEEWRANEERLLVQVERLDDMVAMLRDFSGKDSTLMI